MRRAGVGFLVCALAVVFGMTLIAPLASDAPDGLEHVVDVRGAAIPAPEETPGWALFPDYAWRSGGGALGTITSGVAGTAAVLLGGFVLAKLLARRAPEDPARGGE